MAENIEIELWFYLNSLQKLLPLVVISLNLVEIKFVMCMLEINILYRTIEIFFQVSLR